mmetsp:Transcript_23358/g.64962  ORF Transcript_23358/g.64962 Transcript_23358/m.64962 type:complete len:224 (+) Transcript_23358:343-1014(+)
MSTGSDTAVDAIPPQQVATECEGEVRSEFHWSAWPVFVRRGPVESRSPTCGASIESKKFEGIHEEYEGCLATTRCQMVPAVITVGEKCGRRQPRSVLAFCGCSFTRSLWQRRKHVGKIIRSNQQGRCRNPRHWNHSNVFAHSILGNSLGRTLLGRGRLDQSPTHSGIGRHDYASMQKQRRRRRRRRRRHHLPCENTGSQSTIQQSNASRASHRTTPYALSGRQ